MDSELEKFKTDIDMRVYAVTQGYQLDRKESWKGSAVMRHVNGDKIIIKRGSDGHYIFFSVHNNDDNGSIIDFVQKRMKISLGAVRKELRPYIGVPASQFPAFTPLVKTSKDRLRVESEFAKMADAPAHSYLTNDRASPPRCSRSPALPEEFASTRGEMRCSLTSIWTDYAAMRPRTRASRVLLLAARKASGSAMNTLTTRAWCSAKAPLMP